MTGVTLRLLHDSGPERMPRLTIQGAVLAPAWSKRVVQAGVDGYGRNGTICPRPALALRVRRFIDVSRIGDGCEWGQRSRGTSEFGMKHCCLESDSVPDRIDAIRDLLADYLDLAEDMGDREMRRYSRTDSRRGRTTGNMANKAYSGELAEELLEILRGAPYSGTSATAAEGRISAIRIKAEGANPGTIERDYLEKACSTLKKALRQMGSMGEGKRQCAQEDIAKYRDSKKVIDEMRNMQRRGAHR